MMDIQLADVTVHIDEDLDITRRGQIEDRVRALDGVVSYHSADNTPHLAVVEYNPEQVDSATILDTVKGEGVNAELIGL